MAGSLITTNFNATAATAIVAHPRPCLLTAISIVSATTVTGFVNLYDSSGTVGITVGLAGATVPNGFFTIVAGASDTFVPGQGIGFSNGLVIGSSRTQSGSSSVETNLMVSIVVE